MRNQSTEQFSGLPYIYALLNCLIIMWAPLSVGLYDPPHILCRQGRKGQPKPSVSAVLFIQPAWLKDMGESLQIGDLPLRRTVGVGNMPPMHRIKKSDDASFLRLW
ncbi:hypothetical protein MLD38_027079 [Melastoma candidum]|uniref:Uncharacterized protein n=1 Tax=Melastoma candidum TaxID=119954 RepID=A0ACB9P3H1_9MYRT|nr:hypothetical protein MLD38_027079 [Melastoma candidum]